MKNRGTAPARPVIVSGFVENSAQRPTWWSLPGYRRRTLGGMDAAKEATRTYLRRVPRWWAGKRPAANWQRFSARPAQRAAHHATSRAAT
ncbi:hypothetical protein XvhCFBP2543_04325 [Xanthomonas vasicola]|nr:hypothetical protein XvhCFBP2543_04325 [Xanthomonas vasicola]